MMMAWMVLKAVNLQTSDGDEMEEGKGVGGSEDVMEILTESRS